MDLKNLMPSIRFDLQRHGGTPLSAVGVLWDLPNYAGMLFSADPTKTPFLSMIGGLTGGKQTGNFEFPTSSEYDFTAAAQPGITETASLTASTYRKEYVRDQAKNVVEIHMKDVHLSYEKLANQGRLLGINTVGAVNNVADEMAWQKLTAIKEIARDVEFSFIQGTYNIATTEDTANQTRGILAVAVLSTTVAAATADLSKALIDQCLREMAAAGAAFDNMVILCNAFQMQSLSDIYGYAPMDRNIGGVAIKQILTDFTTLGVVYDPFIPTDDIAIVDVAHCAPVFQPVPLKGNFFYEEISKTGAAEEGQIFGKIGLDYGSVYLHGSITNLSTS